MKRYALLLILSFVFLTIAANSLKAKESFYYEDFDRKGKTAFNGNMGFTLGPDTFLLSPGFDFFLSNELSLGPQIQFGVSDTRILVTGEANLKFQFDIERDYFWKRFKPFVQFGLGAAMFNTSIPGTPSETKFSGLVNIGYGFYIFLNEKIAMGNHMIFNILLPPASERFIFSWHFVTFKYLF